MLLGILLAELTFNKLTVGKIYAGMMVAENWKAFKASQTRHGHIDAVQLHFSFLFHFNVCSLYNMRAFQCWPTVVADPNVTPIRFALNDPSLLPTVFAL